MTYQEFEKTVIEKLKERTGLEIGKCNFPKINGIKQGIVLQDEKNFNGAFPVIYLDQFFEEIQSGENDINGMIEYIVTNYETWKFQNHNMEIKDFMEFENCKNYIFPRLINREKNEEFLRKAVSTSFYDLGVVYYVERVDKYETEYAMLISKKHLEIWNVSENTIIECAKQNIKRNPICIETLGSLLRITSPKISVEEKARKEELYIVTNNGRSYGACEVFRKEVQEKLRDILKGNFYIIPSSVHEMIIIPEQYGVPKEELKRMVKEINITSVTTEEVLSDNIYFYDFSKEKISLVE